MAKKNKLATRVMTEMMQVLAGIDEANEILRPLGVQVVYPAHVEYYEDFGSYTIRYVVDVTAWVDDSQVLITSTRKEVKAEG